MDHYFDELASQLDVIPRPKHHQENVKCITVQSDNQQEEIKIKLHKEFSRILLDTFDKYGLVMNPDKVIEMLIKAGMEDYMRSILDYFHLLDFNQPYFA